MPKKTKKKKLHLTYLLKLAELLEDILGPKFDAAAVPRLGALIMEGAATGG